MAKSPSVRHLTAPRAATATAVLALGVATVGPSPLVAFYAVAVAAAALIGCGFLAYLSAVDAPSPRTVLALATIGLAAALVMADAAVRFPMLLSAHGPAGAGVLVQIAVVLSALSLLSELPALPGRLPRPHADALRELLSR
jgi:hypothetical protein